MPILYTPLQSTDTRNITHLSSKQENLDATPSIDRKADYSSTLLNVDVKIWNQILAGEMLKGKQPDFPGRISMGW